MGSICYTGLAMIDEVPFNQDDSKYVQTFLSLILVSIIFYFLNNVLKLYWPITFSICINYVVCINKGAVNSKFLKIYTSSIFNNKHNKFGCSPDPWSILCSIKLILVDLRAVRKIMYIVETWDMGGPFPNYIKTCILETCRIWIWDLHAASPSPISQVPSPIFWRLNIPGREMGLGERLFQWMPQC